LRTIYLLRAPHSSTPLLLDLGVHMVSSYYDVRLLSWPKSPFFLTRRWDLARLNDYSTPYSCVLFQSSPARPSTPYWPPYALPFSIRRIFFSLFYRCFFLVWNFPSDGLCSFALLFSFIILGGTLAPLTRSFPAFWSFEPSVYFVCDRSPRAL